MTIAADLRAACARIIKRHYGFDLTAHLARSAEAPRHFAIPERDDGKYAPRLFGVYAKAEADFQNARSAL